MLDALSRMPVNSRKTLATGLLLMAFFFALLGAIASVVVLVVVALTIVLLALGLLTMRGNSNRYLAILAGVETIPIQRIAEITNSRPSKVRDDIQSMIDSDMIADFYIDYSADLVVSRKYIPKASYKTVVTCTSCGGNNELIVGITKTCSFCGQPLVLGTT